MLEETVVDLINVGLKMEHICSI